MYRSTFTTITRAGTSNSHSSEEARHVFAAGEYFSRIYDHHHTQDAAVGDLLYTELSGRDGTIHSQWWVIDDQLWPISIAEASDRLTAQLIEEATAELLRAATGL